MPIIELKMNNGKTIELRVVVKRPIKERPETYFKDCCKRQLLGSFFAEKFNKKLAEQGVPKNERLYFNHLCWARVQAQIPNEFGDDEIKNDFMVHIEAYMAGTFKKYTNNKDVVRETAPLVTSLAHSSYVQGDKKMLLTDLQRRNNLLTNYISNLKSTQAENK